MKDVVREQLLALHSEYQWTGWRLFWQRAGRNRLAFYDKFCPECRQPAPCLTRRILRTER